MKIPVRGMWLAGLPMKNLMSGVHEMDLTLFLEKRLQPGMTFVDLGAAVGYFSALADASIGPQGTIVAVEPLFEQFKKIQQNVVTDPSGRRRILILSAVGDTNGVTKISYDDSMGKAALSQLYASTSEQPKHERIVPQITVDDLLENAQLTRLDFIKIDVEGSEPLVLAGMKRTLERWPDCTVVLELSQTCVGRQEKTVTSQLQEYQKYFQKISFIEKNGELIPLEGLDVEELVRKNKHINLACRIIA